jgi:hypothetical protein
VLPQVLRDRADNREVIEYNGTSGAVRNWCSLALGPDEVLNQMNVAVSSRAALARGSKLLTTS